MRWPLRSTCKLRVHMMKRIFTFVQLQSPLNSIDNQRCACVIPCEQIHATSNIRTFVHGHSNSKTCKQVYAQAYMPGLMGMACCSSRSCHTGRPVQAHWPSSCMCEWWFEHQHFHRWQYIRLGPRHGSCRSHLQCNSIQTQVLCWPRARLVAHAVA